MVSVIFWDVQGNRIEDTLPDEEQVDILHSVTEILPDAPVILGELRKVAQTDISKLHQLGQNHFFVFDATMTDGAHYIVRVARFSEPTELSYLRDKVQRECEILKWMGSLDSLPVPKPILCDATSPSPPFMITNKCEGIQVIYGFGTLSEDAKMRNLRSFARFAIAMFQAKCPQQIGSIMRFSSNSESPRDSGSTKVEIGPVVAYRKTETPSQCFSSAQEYIRWLIACKQNRANSVANVKPILRRAEAIFAQETQRQDEEQLRCIPWHGDAVSHNILIDNSGEITGVIDWEFHMILPAYLAVDYPSWITYDGLQDPNFFPTTGQFSPFWPTSRQEATSLRQMYDEHLEIVKKLDHTYYLSLKKGEIARLIMQWLIADEDRELFVRTTTYEDTSD
ncbi:hypothetical protein C8R41DRAFT_923540 [Lentinula lateritia]|uniref:Aminoglycoside phosphotransferase domain-containing protein n=1 Tax=Lentinula lateritia TaxID=40482 RepID=A0ABQ8V967_9AGAR|nr:hypothetical protein C8R41DRAFT_923540 [Lentinula lateritia]